MVHPDQQTPQYYAQILPDSKTNIVSNRVKKCILKTKARNSWLQLQQKLQGSEGNREGQGSH